jgi:branched-chain amino acid transport system substrate-binding protein
VINLKKVVALLLALALVVVIIVSCKPAPAEKEVIKIGHLGLLSGAGAVAGRPILDGALLAVNEINEQGGVLGRKLVLISRDDGGRPEESVRLARELILKEGAQFIQGPFTDACNMAVSQVGKDLKTIILPYVAKTQRLLAPENFHPYIFQPSSNTIYEAGVPALYIAKHKEWKTIYAISPDYEYGRMQTGSFVDWIGKLRPDMQVEQAWPALFETDYTPYITKITASEPDVLFVVQWGGDFIALMKQAAEFKVFDKVKFVATVGENGSNEAAIALGKDYPEDVYADAMDLCYWPDTPEHKTYIEALKNLTGDPYPAGNSIQGYIGIQLLAAAIKKAGTTDTDSVIKALEGLTIDTPLGAMTMGNDHQLQRGEIFGFTKWTSDYPFVVLDQPELVSFNEVVQQR